MEQLDNIARSVRSWSLWRKPLWMWAVGIAILANMPRVIETMLASGRVSPLWELHVLFEVLSAFGLVAGLTLGAIVITHGLANHGARSRKHLAAMIVALALVYITLPFILAPYGVSLLVDIPTTTTLTPLAWVLTNPGTVPNMMWAWEVMLVVVVEIVVAGIVISQAHSLVAPAVAKAPPAPKPAPAPKVEPKVEPTQEPKVTPNSKLEPVPFDPAKLKTGVRYIPGPADAPEVSPEPEPEPVSANGHATERDQQAAEILALEPKAPYSRFAKLWGVSETAARNWMLSRYDRAPDGTWTPKER